MAAALLIIAAGLGLHIGLRPLAAVPATRYLAASRARGIRCSTDVEPTAASSFTAASSEKLPLAAKERLWLESIAAYYNDEKSILSDDDYARLKLDLEFEASKYVTMSSEELKFVIASERYREGKPIMNDVDYDELRKRLKGQNSAAVIHDAPQCKVCPRRRARARVESWAHADRLPPPGPCLPAPAAQVDTGECKSDAVVDQGKNAILYAPGTIAATVLWTESLYWTKRMDPLIAAILGAPIIYLLARLITEKILFQNPLVVSATCPNCSSVINLYFGDVLNVDNANIKETQCDCPVCKTALVANRDTMIVQTVKPLMK